MTFVVVCFLAPGARRSTDAWTYTGGYWECRQVDTWGFNVMFTIATRSAAAAARIAGGTYRNLGSNLTGANT